MSVAARKRRRVGTSSIDLVEEAVGLIRVAPPSAHLAYYLGAIPFWLGLLYFLSDMSQNAYAASHLAHASLTVALLYIWKKCWQAASAAQLHSVLSGRPDQPWNFRRILRLIGMQASIQPWGLILRALAAMVTLPFAWVSAYYQNAVILGNGLAHETPLRTRAWRLARLWPGQLHSVLSIVYLFTIFVWINFAMLLGFLPQILKMFFAVETAYTRGSGFYLSTTFLAATVALTSLAVDPLRKAIFVVRCFRGSALETGDDLAADLQHAKARPSFSLAASLLAATLLFVSTTPSQSAPPIEKPKAAEVSELDQRIEEVLGRREFAWKSPREKTKPSASDSSWLGRWFDSIGKGGQDFVKGIGRQAYKFARWLKSLFSTPSINPPTPSGNIDWVGLGKALLVLLGIALVGLLGWLAWSISRRRKPAVVALATAASAPDLRSEHIVADQLPEDGWMALAREHLARGELSLATRAAWLAGLAHLGQRELIAISRHKTNRDYDRELRRRARERRPLIEAFGQNLTSFERSWYGEHEVTTDLFQQFEGNLDRIRQS